MKEVELSFAKLSYENSLLINDIFLDTNIDLEKARVFVDNINETVQKDVFVSITKAHPNTKFTREARDYLACKPNNIYAAAIVTLNMTHKIIGNFFMKINKPQYPIRFFDTFESAVTWAHTMKKEAEIGEYTNQST